MHDVIHRQSGTWWFYDCSTARGITGAGRSYDESVANAEHSGRQHLSRQAGYELEPADAARHLRHRCSVVRAGRG